MKPIVAIVGRPNVGKSTLFNKLVRRRKALVEDTPGVTRDRNYADAEWGERTFTVVDTGGFVPDEKEPLQKEIRLQAQAAVEEAAVVVFVVDGRAGLTAADQEVGSYLRKSGRQVLVAVNKIDDSRQLSQSGEFYGLGLEPLVEISAEHGRNIEELVDHVLEALPAAPELEAPEENAPIRVAIIGRPNVGKSTLVNALLEEDRLITSGLAGTTRDPIDARLAHKGREFVLTDTAGIRRKAAISQRVEQFAVLGALNTVERSDVAVLLMDATEAAVDQDARIAAIAEEKGRPIVIVVNKWDLVTDPKKQALLKEELAFKLKFISYAPVRYISALRGSSVGKVLDLAAKLHDQSVTRAGTPRLNKLLGHVTTEHPLPFFKGKPLRLYYVAQVAAAPPTFAFTCNMPQAIPDRYKRYLLNQLRETFGLEIPVRLVFRERPGKARRAAKLGRMKGHKRKGRGR